MFNTFTNAIWDSALSIWNKYKKLVEQIHLSPLLYRRGFKTQIVKIYSKENLKNVRENVCVCLNLSKKERISGKIY